MAEAFRGLPELRLTMVGVGPLEASLRAALPDNVELLGWLPRERLSELFAGAGLHPRGRGGLRHLDGRGAGRRSAGTGHRPRRRADIVRPGEDGVLIEDGSDPGDIRAGIRELAGRTWDARVLRRSAERFSEERFRERLAEVLRAHGAR